ncbi:MULTISPECIES: BrnT family toxin [unclassified Rickettsia]|uniref:BrnT family toxin n=1 Tax=unclassified Rickettsia TaxID=114295 RepID=UPI003132F441
MHSSFEWDEEKNKINIQKHNVNFYEAQKAFLDIDRIILEDIDHSITEKRYFCLGKVDDNILTVRFIFRNNCIRIFGAGYWRKGKRIYEQENKIH